MDKICVLWSGGKDCFLAYLLAQSCGLINKAPLFLTFVPRSGYFRCHPLPVLLNHGRKLADSHEFIVIDESDWLADYARAFRFVRSYYGITHVVSGDIMRSREIGACQSGSLGVSTVMNEWLSLLDDCKMSFSAPLSQMYAEDALALLKVCSVSPMITGMANKWYIPHLLGRYLTLEMLKSTKYYGNAHFDLCGEKGEYHTTVSKHGSIVFCDCIEQSLGVIHKDGIWSLAWDEEWLNAPIKRRVLA